MVVRWGFQTGLNILLGLTNLQKDFIALPNSQSLPPFSWRIYFRKFVIVNSFSDPLLTLFKKTLASFITKTISATDRGAVTLRHNLCDRKGAQP